MRALLIVTATVSCLTLAACSETTEVVEPDTAATPTDQVTPERAEAYRAKLKTATMRTIAHIRLAAPSAELRAEADAKLKVLRTEADTPKE